MQRNELPFRKDYDSLLFGIFIGPKVLKIQMIVFLWWSRSTLVFFVFCRNDSSGGHRVLALSLDEIQTG